MAKRKIKSVIYTSDSVVNKNKPKGRGSDSFVVAVLVDDAGMLKDAQGTVLGKGLEYQIYLPPSRLREGVERAKNNLEDTSDVVFTMSSWRKPWTWMK